MAAWEHRLRIFDLFHNDDLSLPEKTEGIVGRIRAARWYDDEDHDLVGLIEELEDAGREDDEHWFNLCWSAFYDYADANRIWVETLGLH